MFLVIWSRFLISFLNNFNSNAFMSVVIALKGINGVLVASDALNTFAKGDGYVVGSSVFDANTKLYDNYDAAGEESLDDCLSNYKVPENFLKRMKNSNAEFIWVIYHKRDIKFYKTFGSLVFDKTNDNMVMAGKYDNLHIPKTNFSKLTLDEISNLLGNIFKDFKHKFTLELTEENMFSNYTQKDSSVTCTRTETDNTT